MGQQDNMYQAPQGMMSARDYKDALQSAPVASFVPTSKDDTHDDPDDDTDEDDATESYEYVSKWKVLFGKHKGTPFKDIPDGYLKWMWQKGVSNNDKVNEYISERLNL